MTSIVITALPNGTGAISIDRHRLKSPVVGTEYEQEEYCEDYGYLTAQARRGKTTFTLADGMQITTPHRYTVRTPL